MTAEIFDAIEKHDMARISEILAQGIDVNMTNESGYTPLHIAIDETYDGGLSEVVKLLIQHGAKVNVERNQVPILLFSWDPTNKEVAKILLEEGADPNVRTSTGDSPLRDCVAEQDLEMVGLLLRSGVGPSIDEWGGERNDGMTALGIAASQFNVPMMKLLIDAGASIEATDDGFKTAREHLPPREDIDPKDWDGFLALAI